jgi:hypothetical protein
MYEQMFSLSPWFGIFWPIVILLAIWESLWKGFGLWKSARNNQPGWFIAMFVFNTVGLLPILYLFWFQNRNKKIKIKKVIETVDIPAKKSKKK